MIDVGNQEEALRQITTIKYDDISNQEEAIVYIKAVVYIIDRFCSQFIYEKEGAFSDAKTYMHNFQKTVSSIINMCNQFEQAWIPEIQFQIHCKLLKLHLFLGSSNIIELISKLTNVDQRFKKYKTKIEQEKILDNNSREKLLQLIGTCPHQLTLEDVTNLKEMSLEIAEAVLDNDQIIRDKDNNLVTANEIITTISFQKNGKKIDRIQLSDCKYLEDKKYYVYCKRETLDEISDQSLREQFQAQLDSPCIVGAKGQNGIKGLGDDIYEIKINGNPRIFGFLTAAKRSDAGEIKLLYFENFIPNAHSNHTAGNYKKQVKSRSITLFASAAHQEKTQPMTNRPR